MSLSDFDYAKVDRGLIVYGLKKGVKCPSSLVIPEGVNVIGETAFEGCPMKKILFPASLKYIYAGAFCDCDKLVEVEFASGSLLYEIEAGSFAYCTSLERISLPKKLHTIGEQVFIDCALSAILIPASVKEIGERVFEGNKMYSVTVDGSPEGRSFHKNFVGNNASVTYTDIFFKKASVAAQKKAAPVSTRITPPTPKTTIKPTQKPIPKPAAPLPKPVATKPVAPKPKYVDRPGYTPYSALEVKEIPEGLELVGIKDRNIKELILPPEITVIGEFAIHRDDMICVFKAGKTLKRIGSYAFDSNRWLTEINFPFTVRLDDSAFYGCIGLDKVILTRDMGSDVYSRTSVARFTCPSDLSVIAKGTFYDTDITEVKIPSSVSVIEDKAFMECKNLERVEFEKNHKISFGASAFSGCTSLTSFRFPDNFYGGIKRGLFAGSVNLRQIDFNNASGWIAEYALVNTSASQFVIPKGLTPLRNSISGRFLSKIVFLGRTLYDLKKMGLDFIAKGYKRPRSVIELVCTDGSITYTEPNH